MILGTIQPAEYSEHAEYQLSYPEDTGEANEVGEKLPIGARERACEWWKSLGKIPGNQHPESL